MKLYHYSSNLYHTLLSRKASTRMVRMNEGSPPMGAFSEGTYLASLERSKKLHLVGSYYDHISFFFDPIPAAMIGQLFENNHHTWFNGHKLFEHVIDTADIPQPFNYDVVESPIALKMLDAAGDWGDNDDLFTAFMIERARAKAKLGETGKGVSELNRQVKQFAGKTEKAFRDAKKRRDWATNRNTYAASVPHVMIYPPKGSIDVRQINSVTIGDDQRTLISVGFEHLSFKW